MSKNINEQIVYGITLADINFAAHSNLGRRLTDKEIKKVPDAFKHLVGRSGLIKMLTSIAYEVMSEAEGWDNWEKRYGDF